MNGETLIALTVGLPPLAGLACYALNNRVIRRLIVAVTALVLIGSSILLYTGGGFSYEPAPIAETVVLVLDSHSWLTSCTLELNTVTFS